MKKQKIKNIDKTLDYLIKKEFKIKNWELWDIPVEYNHCFINRKEHKAFDLSVEKDEIYPSYLDKEICEQKTKTIKEAINKYDNSLYERLGK
jgi:hypothetical protein